MVTEFQNIEAFTPQDKVSERLNQIQSAMEHISSSDEFKQYLAVMGRFHDYSLNNTILIALQNPDATRVAGYNQWNERFERHVKKDEKGIEILAPASGKRHFIQKDMFSKEQLESFLAGNSTTVSIIDKSTGKEYSFSTSLSKFKQEDIPKFLDGQRIREEQSFTWFKPVKVFDVSQTEGKPLPESPIKVNELKGEVEQYSAILNAVKNISPCGIDFVKEENDEALKKGAKGYYSHALKSITIKDGMSNLQTLKTVIHETAHAILHDSDKIEKLPLELRPDRRDREIQAESVACAVCYYFGMDTSEYSFNYVAGWASADVEKFKASMQLIREASSEIITAIDKELYPEKYQQKSKEMEQLKEKRKEYAKNKSNGKSKAWTPHKKAPTPTRERRKEYVSAEPDK